MRQRKCVANELFCFIFILFSYTGNISQIKVLKLQHHSRPKIIQIVWTIKGQQSDWCSTVISSCTKANSFPRNKANLKSNSMEIAYNKIINSHVVTTAHRLTRVWDKNHQKNLTVRSRHNNCNVMCMSRRWKIWLFYLCYKHGPEYTLLFVLFENFRLD